jgi:hypothetical protein
MILMEYISRQQRIWKRQDLVLLLNYFLRLFVRPGAKIIQKEDSELQEKKIWTLAGYETDPFMYENHSACFHES